MAETFKLPVSSYDEIVKLIQAYATEKEGTLLSLDDISHSTGIARTVVSANNGFLVQVGLISEGNKKAATESGRSLGRAYSSKIQDEIVRIWQETIAESDFMMRMLSAVRIRGGMDRANFQNHIIYSSGLKDNKQSKTGASALIDIFKNIGVLQDTDGKLTVSEEASSYNPEENRPISPVVQEPLECVQTIVTATRGVTISININCACTVDDLDSLGERVKKLVEQISGQD